MSRKPENPEARDEMHDETHHERRDAPARPAAGSLEGRILVVMPGLRDPRFAQTVIYLCAHTEDGAMGLIVNKPTLDLSFPDLLSQLDIDPSPEAERIRVHYGGPVETGRGFVGAGAARAGDRRERLARLPDLARGDLRRRRLRQMGRRHAQHRRRSGAAVLAGRAGLTRRRADQKTIGVPR